LTSTDGVRARFLRAPRRGVELVDWDGRASCKKLKVSKGRAVGGGTTKTCLLWSGALRAGGGHRLRPSHPGVTDDLQGERISEERKEREEKGCVRTDELEVPFDSPVPLETLSEVEV
jgi:hypothetical protein